MQATPSISYDQVVRVKYNLADSTIVYEHGIRLPTVPVKGKGQAAVKTQSNPLAHSHHCANSKSDSNLFQAEETERSREDRKHIFAIGRCFSTVG